MRNRVKYSPDVAKATAVKSNKYTTQRILKGQFLAFENTDYAA